MKRALALVGGVVGSFIAIVVIAVVGPQIKRASWLDSFQTDPHRTQRQRFKMLKIRSMYLKADSQKAELMKDNRVSDGICSSWIETRASSETKSLMVS